MEAFATPPRKSFTLPPLDAIKKREEADHRAPIERVLTALSRRGKNVKKWKRSQWLAQCPAHDDRNPSLSITEDRTGKVLINCLAGCESTDVLSELGLEMHDLFPSDLTPLDAPPIRREQKRVATPPSASTAREERYETHSRKRGDDIHYNYVDSDGVVRFTVVRKNLPGRKKEFRQFRHNADGQKIYNLEGVDRIPFGMPELLNNPDETIHLCEGEKDAITLRKRGVLATSIPKGEFGEESLSCFRDRHVVIHQDNDEPGRKEAEGRADWLLPAAASIRIMTYEDLPEKGDVTDWIRSGNSIGDLLERVDDLPLYEPENAESDESTIWKPFVPLDKEYGPPFPTEYLPANLRDYVQAVTGTMQVTDDMSAVAVLGALSTAVGGKYIVQLGAWDEPVHGYFIVAADSGSRKSGTLDLVAKPIREWQAARNVDERIPVADWHSRHRVLSSALKRAENPPTAKSGMADQRLGADADRASALAELLEHEGKQVFPTVVVIDDATPEAATERLIEQGGALAAMAGESKMLENLSSYRQQADFDLLLKGHAAEPLRVDRKTSEAQSIDRACLTLFLMTQPSYIRKFAGDPDAGGRGLLQRFLISFSRDVVGHRLTGRNVPVMPAHLQASWEETINRLLDQARLPGQRFESSHPSTLAMSEGALVYFDHFSAWNEKSMRGIRGDFRGWCSKQVGAAVRIAALLHLSHNRPDLPISAEDMLSGIVISQWFRDHAEIMFRGVDSSQTDAVELLQWLRDFPETVVSRADIWSGLRKRARWTSPKQLDAALDVLEIHNAVIIQEHKTGGRPTKTVFVNPEIREEHSMDGGYDEETSARNLARYLQEMANEELETDSSSRESDYEDYDDDYDEYSAE